MSTQVQTISCEEVARLCEGDNHIELIDVRTPIEFREVHSAFARNVPLDTLDPQAVTSSRNVSSDQPLYVICRSGKRAERACETLISAGCPHVINVTGGTQAWEAAGLPVVRGKKAVSLERQVRIAAGFLVLLGVILGFVHHEFWFGLSAFVGAGLMFAGITDTCAMGMLIAKMPWNRVSSEPAATSPNEQKQPADSCCS